MNINAYWDSHIHPNFIFKPTRYTFIKVKLTGDSHQKLSLAKLILAQTVNYIPHFIKA